MKHRDLQSHVKKIIDRTDAAPFLFIGTGMSKRYLDAESWEDLLRWAASLTNEPYSYYEQQARRESSSDVDNLSPLIGSLIDDAFNEIWWKDDKYLEERSRLEHDKAIPESPLKHQVAKRMREVSDRYFPDKYEQEIEVLKNATIDGIITTNYDTILEKRLYEEYTSYSGQDAIIFAEQYAVAEIYKIHGSATDPDSLVLTAEDYQAFNERNAYLAAKLITIFLEHPVIFLGYSISDPNVQTILASVIRCLKDPVRLKKLGERLIFVEYNPKDESPEVGPSSRLVQRRDLKLTRIHAHDFTPIFRALAERKRHMNAKLVRQVKEQMYELVKTNDPQGKLHVLDMEDLDEYDDVEIVVGVGVREQLARVGLEEIQMNELFQDLIEGGGRFDDFADEVVTVRVKNWIVKRGGRFAPIYKYLSTGGLLGDDLKVRKDEVPPAVYKVANMTRDRFKYGVGKNTENEYKDKTVDQVISEFGDRVKICRYLTLLEDPDVEELRSYLQDNLDLLEDDRGGLPFRWLCCIYDRLKYGPDFDAFETE